MTKQAAKRYRVVQWATGNVGARALRRVIEHPDFDLVGVWVHSEAKQGVDAGVLAGTDATGVLATNSIDNVIALQPDCVLYMPHECSYDEICRILESGANIVTTRMELQNVAALDADVCARIEAACRAGGSSIHATGSSPGFISEALPILLASIQRRMDSLVIQEFADVSSRNSPEMIFGMMGFGSEPGPTPDWQLHHARLCFGPSLQLVADAIGLPFDEIRVSGAQGVARNDVQIAAGTVPKGTVAATRTRVDGMRNGRALMSFTTTWFVSDDVDTTDGEAWEFRSPSGWLVEMQGDCPIRLEITFPVAEEDYAEMTPGLTAHRPVNAIEAVCEAAPGIVTTVDLPQIIAKLAD